MQLATTRFMRKPFFVDGIEVTLDNMKAVAEWCHGHVVENTEKPFVRVPVFRASNRRQTEAYIGFWVLISKHRGERSFKVYDPEWLNEHFWLANDIHTEEPEILEVRETEVSSANEIDDVMNKTRAIPTPGTMAATFLSGKR